MRKVILTLLFSAFGLYAMGQNAMIAPPRYLPATPGQVKITVKNGGAVSATNSVGLVNWYKNREDAAESGVEDYTWYHTTVFSDSSAQVLYGDGNGGTKLGYVFNQGYGEVFDPRAEIYDTANGVLSLYNTYTVDSLALPYQYHYVAERNRDTLNTDTVAHDTLIFQFYSVTTAGVDTGSYGAQASPPFPASPFATVRYNYKTNLGTTTYSPTATYTYVMGAKDSTTGNAIGLLDIPVMANKDNVGITVDSKNRKTGYNKDLFAYTVSYRPGFKYKFGDTIDEQQTTPVPKNLHSHFQVLIGEDEPAGFVGGKSPIDFKEMSLELISQTRYNSWPAAQAGFDGQYMPGTVWLAYNEVLWSWFHIYLPNDAAVNQNPADPKGYVLGNVYPNPASGSANLNFALGNTEQVKITLYDMLGHEIGVLADGQYMQGTHTIAFNTENLKEGVYLYSINAGSFAKTLKFTVAHN